jgi:membrane associated rhomboid family serine protease
MFIILPVGVDYRAKRYPVVTFTLMGICVVVYLAHTIIRLSGNTEAVDEWVFGHLWLVPSEAHWWTYLTSQFVHEGFFHLLGNMIYLFLFGSCVEDMIGRWRFTIFYLLCGIIAAFSHVMVSPDHFSSDIPMGGASGAISGCIGGFLLLLAKARIDFKWILYFFFRFYNGDFALPAWLVISFWFLQDVGYMILANQLNPHGGGVAFAAHVGGTLCGAGLLAIEKVRLKIMPGASEPEEAAEEPAVMLVAEQPKPEVKRRFVVGGTPAPVMAVTPTILLYRNGEQSGPFTAEQVRQMSLAGELPEDALYWREGMPEWKPVGELT